MDVCLIEHCCSCHTYIIKLEVNGNLVTLHPGCSQLFSENKDIIMKNDVDESFMNIMSIIVLYYYLEGDVDVAHYTTTSALFNAEIKMIQSCCIFLEDALFKPLKVKGDGSCL